MVLEQKIHKLEAEKADAVQVLPHMSLLTHANIQLFYFVIAGSRRVEVTTG